ncbi:MAG TPA: DNA-3-methyladenine glycosylase 2 family protein, partial [Anaerolineae bacterium]
MTRQLVAHDCDLAQVVVRLGVPPLWEREPGFATLVHIILEQQVSLASARAANNRLRVALGEVTPKNLLGLSDSHMKEIGFSRQKMSYARILAEAVLDRTLDLEALANLDDDQVRVELTRVKGIGRWTADIYLLMGLCRPDIWPIGDLALLSAVRDVKRLDHTPTHDELDLIIANWRPYRAVAARVLWHHYL